VPLRQENTMCGDTVRAEPMGQLFGSLLAAPVVIHVEGEIDGAWPLAQLTELVGIEMRA